MKIIIIGAVAGGTTAATKIRRNSEEATITIYEKDVDISYSGCGLPYYIGGVTSDLTDIVPRDPRFFKEKHQIDIHTQQEVLSINRNEKSIQIKNLVTGEIYTDTYDQLILSTGASVFVPPIVGVDLDHVFFLRTVQDAARIKEFINKKQPKKAVIVGSGAIGLEMLENFNRLGIETKVVEMKELINPNLDMDMSKLLSKKLRDKGVDLRLSSEVTGISKDGVRLAGGEILEAQLVLMATGVKPNINLAKEAGITIGVSGAIEVDEFMRTSDENIYAVGDCAETYDSITGKKVYRPLGSTANKMGRICGDVITGGTMSYRGNIGTGIFRVFDLSAGTTGLSEREAREAGYNIEIVHMTKPDRPPYQGGRDMVIKAIADVESRQLLGVQIVGYEGVDKRLDVFVTLISLKGSVDDLFHLDLAYSPPFSTTKDPVHYVGMVLSGSSSMISSEELLQQENVQLVDARSLSDYENRGHLPGALHIPHQKLREQLESLNKDETVVVYCNSGTTGNAVLNLLKNRGFKRVFNLSGGNELYQNTKK